MSDLDLREGDVADAEVLAEIATLMRPDEPVDPVVERYFLEQRTADQVERLWMAHLDREPVGFVITVHRAWPDDDEVRASHIELGITPGAANPSRVRQLIASGVDFVRRDGARVVECYAREDEGWLREALLACGLEEDHRSKIWELHLPANRDRLLEITAQCRERSRSDGLRCLPLSDCSLPDKLDRLHRLSELARRDVPRSVPALPNPKSLFLRWLNLPGVTPERYWVAELAGELVGFSYLRYPPVRGNVWTGFTGSHPAHRGRGIAKAVKMETLAQALELGVPLVRTDNDERNAPMLHINESLGYHPIPAWVAHVKRLG